MSDDDRNEDEVEVEETETNDTEEQCCVDGSCGCEFDTEEEVKELRKEVETLRTEVDFLIDRMNVRTLIDYEE